MVIRVPVKYKKRPLMPTRLSKAKRLVSEGKAKWKHSKKFRLSYLQLLVPPSSYEFQDLQLGYDPGSHFDGFSLSSKRYNHLNLELIHNKGVKDRMDSRRGNRRLRRSRLRRRPTRFDSRTSSKITPTMRSMLEFRKFTISHILELFPISRVIVEVVKSSNFKQSSWTQVHQCQEQFITYLRDLGLRVTRIRGYTTKRVRVKLFGKDLKNPDKGARDFYAHCLDSFSMSRLGFKSFKLPRITPTRFITKNWLNRRELFKSRKLTGNKKYFFRYVKPNTSNAEYLNGYWKPNGKYVKPGWIIWIEPNIGKPNVGYFQKYPNSFREFELFTNSRTERFKYASKPQNYGGTIAVGQSRTPVPRGRSKCCIFRNGYSGGDLLGYSNRSVQINLI